MNENVVRLVFRAERSGDFKGEVTAVYDEPLGTKGGERNYLNTYAHMGQHSSGSYGWYRRTRPATPDEYAPLLRELSDIIGRHDAGATVIVGRRLVNLYR